MAHGSITEATAFPLPINPATSSGVEGEMARVSIASLLEGGPPATVDSAGNGGSYVTVGQHGMIADLYSSGSLSPVALDYGLATPSNPASPDGVVRHDSFDAGSGAMQLPSAGLLDLAGAQHIPNEIHVPDAGQSAPGATEMSAWFAPAEALSAVNGFEVGHSEMATHFGSDGLAAPLTAQHFMV